MIHILLVYLPLYGPFYRIGANCCPTTKKHIAVRQPKNTNTKKHLSIPILDVYKDPSIIY